MLSPNGSRWGPEGFSFFRLAGGVFAAPNVCRCSEYPTLTSLPGEAAGKSLLIKGQHMVGVCVCISGLKELKWELSLLLAFLNGLRLLLSVALLKPWEEFRSVFKQWKIQDTNFHSLLTEALNRRSFSPDLLLQNNLFSPVRWWYDFFLAWLKQQKWLESDLQLQGYTGVVKGLCVVSSPVGFCCT